MMGRNLRMAAIGAGVLLLAGCAAADEEVEPALDTDATEVVTAVEVSDDCQQAVDQVAGAEDLSTAVEQVDAALSSCVNIEELRAAAADIEGVDMQQIESFIAERCEVSDDPLITESDICQQVTG